MSPGKSTCQFRSIVMRACSIAFVLALSVGLAVPAYSQSAAGTDEKPLPAPGTRGNADNVKYIGGKDPEGNAVRLAKATGHVSNYSEDKVAPYTLPDPLKMNDGRPVTSAEMWFKERRPEILKFYETQIYGRVPGNAPKVTWELAETDPNARDGKATMHHLVGHMGDKFGGPKMNVTMYLPNDAKWPVPMMLSISFNFGPGAPRGGAARGLAAQGNADANADGKAEAPKAPPPRPAFGGGFDSIGEVLSRGWGYATLTYSDVQPDKANAWNQGVVSLTLKDGQTQPAPDEWGTISCWAWGISRTIDYFETDKRVDAKKIAITGTSRLGKTVLWAGAQDPRVAAVFSVVSGEMGAALIRRDWGETLDDMAQNFPYQFAGNLQRWAGRWNDLPVDQHMLIALIAPRPVYVNGGISDQWSDPKGEFLSMVAAGPVYKLLGGKDLGVTEVPELDHPITTGDLAFHYHSGGHQAVPADWKEFLNFAERHFKSQ
jgi:hypothetical protein